MLTPAEINPEKVAIYIRWSTDDQGEGTTLQTQLERCKCYLGSQGWTFQERLIYIDDGYSGGTLVRPALAQLRADVAAGRIECVVVYKIDRLSRSVVDIVDLVLREWEGRCFVKSTTEDVNTISPAGKMFFYILVSFAEYERNVIRERTMGGKVKRAEQGLNPGFRPPYGYTRGAAPGEVAVVAHEASVVQRIFELFVKGNGPGRIMEMLNAEGLRRRGAPWNQLMIRRLLANPAYMGVLEYGRTMRTARDPRTRGKRAGVIRFETPRFARVEGAFPAVVSQETWEKAGALLQERSRQQAAFGARPSYSGYFLTGLAVCACGAPVVGKSVGDRRYYLCSARKRKGRAACDAGHIPVEPVHRALEERVRVLLAVEGRQALVGNLAAAVEARIGETGAALRQQQAALNAIAERRRRLESDYRSGDLPARLYTHELQAAESEDQQARQQAQHLERRLATLRQVAQDRDRLAQSLSAVHPWDDLNLPERKRLLQKITQAIQLYRPVNSGAPPTLTIEWIRPQTHGQADG